MRLPWSAEQEVPPTRVLPKGMVSESDRAQVVDALTRGTGRPADAEELDAALAWLAWVRMQYALAEMVLRGDFTLRMRADGRPEFNLPGQSGRSPSS